MPDEFKGHASIDELTMLRDLLILPHMLTMVDQSNETTKHSGNFLRAFHTELGEAVMDLITRDLGDIRQELRRRRIKTWEAERSEFVLNLGYNCRGYESVFGMTVEVAKAEIGIRLGQYISKLAHQIRPGRK